MNGVAKPNLLPPRWRRLVFTILLLLIAAIILMVGSLHGLVAPWTTRWVDAEAGVHHPVLHRWHDGQWGALGAILFVGSLLAMLRQPHRTPLLAQFFALGSLVMVVAVAPFDRGIVIFLILALVMAAAYPAPRRLLHFSREGPLSRPLLVLTVAMAAALTPISWRALRFQIDDPMSEHSVANHWIMAVALALVLVLAGLLTATKRPGWRALGTITGLCLLDLGAAALHLPHQAGSWGITGGLLAVAGGAAYLILTYLESRHVTEPAPSAATLAYE